jgi:hypothetical protein
MRGYKREPQAANSICPASTVNAMAAAALHAYCANCRLQTVPGRRVSGMLAGTCKSSSTKLVQV